MVQLNRSITSLCCRSCFEVESVIWPVSIPMVPAGTTAPVTLLEATVSPTSFPSCPRWPAGASKRSLNLAASHSLAWKHRHPWRPSRQLLRTELQLQKNGHFLVGAPQTSRVALAEVSLELKAQEVCPALVG